MRQASGLAREGAGTIGAAQRRVIYAVQDAHNAGFNVEEDLSVTDTRTSRTFAEQAARQAQAQALAGDIRQRATQLIGVEHEVAAKIATATAPLDTVGFHEPPIAPSLPTPVPHNEKPQIHAVDRSWKQDPPSPMPGDPKDMTAVQARAAWDAVNADIARYNARCGRTFVLPNEQAAYDACIADKGSLLERQAAIRARLGELGVPVEGEPPPAPDPAGPQPNEGLPPPGVSPPAESNLTVGPPSRPIQQARGGESLWDENGGEWRYFPGDNYRYPHWDYNPHDSPTARWQNIPIGDLPTHK